MYYKALLCLTVVISLIHSTVVTAAVPADVEGLIRELTSKLASPSLSAREKSELYRRRADAYLRAVEPATHADRRKAVDDLAAAVRVDPTDAEAYVELGNQTYAEASDRFDAGGKSDTSILDVAVKRSMADYATALRIGLSSAKDRSEVYYNRATMDVYNIDTGFEAAINDLNAAIQADDHNGDLFFLRGLDYEQRAFGSETIHTKAIADMSTALSLPLHIFGYCAVHTWRGDTYDELKKYDLAATDYSSAITMAKATGSAASCWNEYVGPVYGADTPLSTSNDIGNLYFRRAQEYDKMGKIYLAIADYTTIIADRPKILSDSDDLQPTIQEAYLARADDYEKAGQRAKAAADRIAGGDYGPPRGETNESEAPP